MLSDRELERYGENFLQSFEAIRRSLTLYPGNHPKVAEQLDRFVKNLHELHGHVGQATFNVIHKEFFINGLPLKRLSLAYTKSLGSWEAMGLGLVRFGLDTTRESALRFFETLARSPEEIQAAGGLAALLHSSGVSGIRVAGVTSELESDVVPVFDEVALKGVEAATPEEARGRFLDSRGELSAMVDRAWGTTSNPSRMLRTAFHLIEKRLLERHAVQDLMAQLKEHDEPSWRHALDGSLVALLMARVLGFPRNRLTVLAEAVLLRDIGKLKVSRDALLAPESDDAAREEYRRHPVEGARLLLEAREIDAGAAIVAYEHHVRFDGRGFPRLRSRKGMHAFSRIAQVASDYDRMTAGSAGDARLLPAEALKRLHQGAGSIYDPSAVRALIALTGLVPEGTAVELRDGSYGVVAGPGDRHWGQPEVALLKDASGAEVEPRIEKTSDLFTGPEPVITATFTPTREDAERLESLRIA